MLTKFYIKKCFRKPMKWFVTLFEALGDKYFDAIVVADNFVFEHFKNKNKIILFNYPDIELMNRSMLNNPQKKYDVIFPGSMSKFTANIILEIAKICKDNGRVIRCALISPFHFVGGIQWVKCRIKELGLSEDNFLLKGRIPTYEVPQYIQKARIGLVPLPDTLKMRSNIPTKIFEYMYCGIPVLTGDLPPSAQYIRDTGAGYLLPPDCAQAYAEKILELLASPALCERLGRAGRRLVEEKCNWQRESDKLIKLYEKIL